MFWYTFQVDGGVKLSGVSGVQLPTYEAALRHACEKLYKHALNRRRVILVVYQGAIAIETQSIQRKVA